MNSRRSYWWIILIFGLALGLGVGVLVAWGIPQAQPIDTSPASLRADFKDEYRYMIAASYTLTGDLGRAQARLTTLNETDPILALKEQAQRMLAQNTSIERIRILANLSEALQAQPTITAAPGATSAEEPPASPTSIQEPVQAATPEPLETETPAIASEAEITAIPTPIFTATPRPARTATPTQGVPFTLFNQTSSCETRQPGLLQIELKDRAGKPVPGIELIVTWFGGEEHFFTGFKNEISPGYADFVMAANTEYALSLSGGSTRLTGLLAPACTNSQGNAYPGLIRLEFQQP